MKQNIFRNLNFSTIGSTEVFQSPFHSLDYCKNEDQRNLKDVVVKDKSGTLARTFHQYQMLGFKETVITGTPDQEMGGCIIETIEILLYQSHRY